MNKNDFGDLFGILKLVGGKFIIIEDGKPRAVLMDYEEFSELVAPMAAKNLMDRFNRAEDVNREITRAQMQDLEEVRTDSQTAKEEINEEIEEIRIEPL